MHVNQVSNKVLVILIPLYLVSLFSCAASGFKVVHLSEYGITPGTKQNTTPIFQKILDDYKDVDTLHILLEEGRYDFYDSLTAKRGAKDAAIGISLEGRKNIVIDGQGAELIFHGKMIVCDILESEDITLRNLTIDWDRPYNSQATVVNVTNGYIDFEIDSDLYPYEVVNDSIFFLIEGKPHNIVPQYTNLFESRTKNIVYQTRDRPLGEELFHAKVSVIGTNRVRFHCTTKYQPLVGTIVVLFHGTYIANGIDVRRSKDVVVENVTIYHTLNCGLHGYMSENISLKNVHIINNEKKGRAFSTLADATHFNGCKGQILFDGCSVGGAGDDFMNIHGMYAIVDEIVDDRTVVLTSAGRYIGFKKDDVAWVVDSAKMQRTQELKIKSHVPVYNADKTVKGYQITFYHAVDDRIKPGDLLENKDRNPSLIVRNCSMMKQNRARSILVTTTGDVLIENNYFNSAGAAIAIEGDTKLWYESGGVNNVVIRNNIFENCYTSGNNIVDDPWGWGEGVISITPSVRPSGVDFPTYHSNILITDNTFRHFDYQVLFARATNNLTFTNNILERTYDYEPFYRKTNFYLDGCRNVSIRDNIFDTDFLGRSMTIKNMRKSDIIQNKNPQLTIMVE